METTMRQAAAAIVVATLVATVSLSAGQGPASLSDAQRALDDALESHDRSAFVAVLAPDASVFLPVPAHGADAIAAAWMPFLMSGANTLTLTPQAPVVAASGDMAYVAGTFAITAVGNAPVKPASGEYVAVWRVIDGRWKLSALGGAGTPGTRPAGGLGGYRLGMTADEVRGVSECQPYTNVSQTGGLECANYTFEGRRTNISFVFANSRLRRIQLWMYEGSSETDARDAIGRVIDHLKRVAGGVVVGGQPNVEVTAERVMGMLGGSSPEPGRSIQFDLSTPATSQPETWFARVVKFRSPVQQLGYLVLLLVDPRPGQ
jgi:ketosteroid isomerase-like protein